MVPKWSLFTNNCLDPHFLQVTADLFFKQPIKTKIGIIIVNILLILEIHHQSLLFFLAAIGYGLLI